MSRKDNGVFTGTHGGKTSGGGTPLVARLERVVSHQKSQVSECISPSLSYLRTETEENELHYKDSK